VLGGRLAFALTYALDIPDEVLVPDALSFVFRFGDTYVGSGL